MEITNLQYFIERKTLRKWFTENFDKEQEVWLLYPRKSTGKKRILYNDAVEEALCFGWIDSIIKKVDKENSAQKFTPRRPKSLYSQPNKERLKWLFQRNLIHPSIEDSITPIIQEKFTFPRDIIDSLKQDDDVWENFSNFSDSYKRLRIAYIESARKRPQEYQKRLNYFIKKTKSNQLIKGFGGIEKYY